MPNQCNFDQSKGPYACRRYYLNNTKQHYKHFCQKLEKIVTLSDRHKSRVSMSKMLTLRKFSHNFDIVKK